MTVEFGPDAPVQKKDKVSPSEVIFDSRDPRASNLTREERVKLYYAQQLADGNLDALAPRYRSSEFGNADDPWQDTLVADPLSDPQIGALASMIKVVRGDEGSKKS